MNLNTNGWHNEFETPQRKKVRGNPFRKINRVIGPYKSIIRIVLWFALFYLIGWKIALVLLLLDYMRR